ncbi:hypothetical protein CERZMDRAFT_99379 [Cercospora zeae-maydis SCOH1-5]|uniref:Uncharacterized protein n=1 Tax=Cercospora zeae-maydis SCOH1-5 TaxID=717836 RepID=A0A6A6FA73_9PEZI|nr:hypothetical protein CERZMDRAFT_99379 [Cercospora zeae-maydis SCOH1-5]
MTCNKKWQTHDSYESLYQEIFFQHCCSTTTKAKLRWLNEKHGDRLRLPLVLFMHSPLRLSVAHREHGFGMHTGWPSNTSPVDVRERIANDEENNMLIESWYVNSVKFDMATEYYDILDDILTKVEITNKQIYNPTSDVIKYGDVELAERDPMEVANGMFCEGGMNKTWNWRYVLGATRWTC